MVKLKDIAKHTGFSVTQVSRAINNHSDVSEETKKIIMKAVDELGYVPNLAAKKLASKSDNTIALIIVGFEKQYSSNDMLTGIMSGVFNCATEHNHEVMLYLYSENIKNKKSYLQFCKERGVSGAVLCGMKRDDKNLKELIKSDFPIVVIDIPYLTENIGSVVVDNEKYSYLAVKSLIDNGYKKIGMINGSESAHVSIERKMGYINALNDNNMEVDEFIIKDGEFSTEKAKECADEIIKKGVDAIFCASDLMAMGVLKSAKEQDINVPEELAIFGFDGINIVDYTTPTISTIKQNSYDKGYKASQLLIDYLEKKIPMRVVKSECEVCVQESSLKKK